MHDPAMRAYLEEHLVGARTITHLVDRRLDDEVGPAWLETFREDLEQDRQVVERIATQLDASAPAPSKAAGVAAQAGLRGAMRVTEAVHDELRDLIEFETMYIGVQGKACLWRALQLFADEPALAGVDLDMLESRAAEHAERLEEFRVQAARELEEDTSRSR